MKYSFRPRTSRCWRPTKQKPCPSSNRKACRSAVGASARCKNQSFLLTSRATASATDSRQACSEECGQRISATSCCRNRSFRRLQHLTGEPLGHLGKALVVGMDRRGIKQGDVVI